jgi:uncharacterized membrane protein YeaQ/YmgE (transglycosylase-associated protein family)
VTCSSSSCDQLFDERREPPRSNERDRVCVNHSSTGVPMTIIGWLILGLIAGFIASKIVNKTGEGILLDIVLGIAGAFVGGFIFTSVLGHEGVTGFNLYSMFVAVIGAIVLLVLYHALFRRRVL